MKAMRTWFHFISFENMKKPHKFIRCELYYINALNRNLLPDTYLYGIRMLYPTKRYNYTPRKNPWYLPPHRYRIFTKKIPETEHANSMCLRLYSLLACVFLFDLCSKSRCNENKNEGYRISTHCFIISFFSFFFSSWKSDSNISHRILKFKLDNDGFLSSSPWRLFRGTHSSRLNCSQKKSIRLHFDRTWCPASFFSLSVISFRFVDSFPSCWAQLNTCARTVSLNVQVNALFEMWIDISHNTGLRWELAIFGTWKTAKPFLNK